MKEQPAYYAIIPASVRYADIIPNAKLLYGELTALANKDGYCWASNQYFADLYKVNKTTISEWIRILIEKGFIYSEVINNFERKIYITPSGKAEGVSTKSRRGGSGFPEHNITVNNTTKTGEQSSQEYVFVSEDEKPPKVKNFDPQPVYNVFKDELGIAPLNWKTNKTQRQSAENLLTERGLDQIRKALQFYKEVKEEQFCPAILSPYDLDSKWHKLLKLKN